VYSFFNLYAVVSIPHRYGKNARPETKMFMKVLFPFLIGTVRTRELAEELAKNEQGFHSS